MIFARTNIEANPKIRKKYGEEKNAPFFRFFHQGKSEKYSGGTTSADLL